MNCDLLVMPEAPLPVDTRTIAQTWRLPCDCKVAKRGHGFGLLILTNLGDSTEIVFI